MKTEIKGNFSGRAPFALITFRFTKIDAETGLKILKDLKLETGVLIYDLENYKGTSYKVIRSSLTYHMQDKLLAVMVCYQSTFPEVFSSARESIESDTKSILEILGLALDIFDDSQ